MLLPSVLENLNHGKASDPRAEFSTDHDEDSMFSIEDDEEESTDKKRDESFPTAEPSTYYPFVLHFQEQLWKLDGLQDDPGARFSPEMQKILLQNDVQPVPELHSIQTTVEQLITSTGS